MKSLLYASLLFFGFALLLGACSKEKSVDTGITPGNVSGWEFKEGANAFNGKVDSAIITSSAGLKQLSIKGTSTDGSGTFFLNVFAANIAVGTYTTPSVYFQYALAGSPFLESDPTATGAFTVTITKIDSSAVTGTFSGQAQDLSGNIKTITQGKFTATLVKTSPVSNGQLMLWSKTACGSGGNILVKVQGTAGTISAFQTTEPTCGTSGTALFTLAPGNYLWTAYCGSDSTTGVATIVSGTCTKSEVIFTPAGATCRISNIGFLDPGTNAGEGAINTFYTGTQPTRVEFYDSLAAAAANVYNITYATNRINLDTAQYFLLGLGNVVSEFHGFADPTDNTTPKVIIKYQYDALGYMSKAIMYLEQLPTVPVLQTDYVWTNGNLTKATVSEAATNSRSEYLYEYDLTKQAKGFLCFFPNTEFLLFQGVVNYGKNSVNPVAKSTINDYDNFGALQNSDVANFSQYVMDANGYVKGFLTTGGNSIYGSNARYALGYKCQ